MRIARIETFQVAPRWLLCRLETDEGAVGWGEATLEGRAATVRTAVHELEALVVGQDAGCVEDLWQQMTRGTFYRGGPVLSSAVAGIDQALWDLRGRVLGVPVHNLLGGPVRDRVRTYTWVGGDTPSMLRDDLEQRIAQGFTAVKMNAAGRYPAAATPADRDGVLSRARLARDVLGDDRHFAIDFHGRIGPSEARQILPRLADAAPIFVEEPVLPELREQLPRLVDASPVPLATGERLFSRWDFRRVLEAGIAVVQPDISHAGGISEVRRIGDLASVYGALLAPHCPLGPVALAASLQVAFALPNFLIQEYAGDIHYNTSGDGWDDIVDAHAIRPVQGFIECPTAPGLGIDVDERAVRAADRVGHNWQSPIWRHDDGGFAEW